ncbi:hypothetical protein [Dyella sp.]|uniref:hypothetical protein n=1 Tax=Dyella sp. TaxID=1869338 RepID=UPI003F7D3640
MRLSDPALRRPLRWSIATLCLLVGLAGCGRHDVAAPGASAGGDQDGVSILLNLADQALAEHRLVAPAGANAYEFYLSVLELDPANAAARQHLGEQMPDAMAAVEQAINARQLDEAERELRLLREADSSNFTLSLLAGKLDAQRMIVVREDEARAAAIRAKAEAAEEAAAAR